MDAVLQAPIGKPAAVEWPGPGTMPDMSVVDRPKSVQVWELRARAVPGWRQPGPAPVRSELGALVEAAALELEQEVKEPGRPAAPPRPAW